ncbi:uncharacterized protein LOC106167500 [Lingula anatina]|uniref:Uncharacterized protein LOC106167500 n=1 Tax=Lingula anatina TaxID=7574 RepID=A0A1S3IU60_LINAN|nr:uncharacterized protein LOC106167500 [Lingula anatina]XP_013401746.1 uncharacterized protein LOC106167500 [Lingula anatina]|eukprot:XP_013401745.1 uncharacterized protein LOC106167500 [Lingula anatina]
MALKHAVKTTLLSLKPKCSAIYSRNCSSNGSILLGDCLGLTRQSEDRYIQYNADPKDSYVSDYASRGGEVIPPKKRFHLQKLPDRFRQHLSASSTRLVEKEYKEFQQAGNVDRKNVMQYMFACTAMYQQSISEKAKLQQDQLYEVELKNILNSQISEEFIGSSSSSEVNDILYVGQYISSTFHPFFDKLQYWMSPLWRRWTVADRLRHAKEWLLLSMVHDCSYEVMTKEIVHFLKSLIKADNSLNLTPVEIDLLCGTIDVLCLSKYSLNGFVADELIDLSASLLAIVEKDLFQQGDEPWPNYNLNLFLRANVMAERVLNFSVLSDILKHIQTLARASKYLDVSLTCNFLDALFAQRTNMEQHSKLVVSLMSTISLYIQCQAMTTVELVILSSAVSRQNYLCPPLLKKAEEAFHDSQRVAHLTRKLLNPMLNASMRSGCIPDVHCVKKITKLVQDPRFICILKPRKSGSELLKLIKGSFALGSHEISESLLEVLFDPDTEKVLQAEFLTLTKRSIWNAMQLLEIYGAIETIGFLDHYIARIPTSMFKLPAVQYAVNYTKTMYHRTDFRFLLHVLEGAVGKEKIRTLPMPSMRTVILEMCLDCKGNLIDMKQVPPLIDKNGRLRREHPSSSSVVWRRIAVRPLHYRHFLINRSQLNGWEQMKLQYLRNMGYHGIVLPIRLLEQAPGKLDEAFRGALKELGWSGK